MHRVSGFRVFSRLLACGCVCGLVLSVAGCRSAGGASDLRLDLAQTKMKVVELETAQAETLKKLQYNMDELQRLVENQRKTSDDNNANCRLRLTSCAKRRRRAPPRRNRSRIMRLRPAPGDGQRGAGAHFPQRANQAYSLGKYNEAIDLYTSFILDYRDSPKAPNAAYELGRCYFSSNDFEKAQRAFRHVLDTYPTSAIIPDSMISLALCQLKLTKYKEARETLKTLQTRYPDYSPDLIKTIQSQMPPA
jgi:tol-pal system protein YbgF